MRYVENRGTSCQAQNQPDQGPLEQEDCVRQGDCQGGVWVCYFAEGQLMEAMANLWNRLAPYERRVIELLRNSKDKRARKLAKKRVRLKAYVVNGGVI